MAYANPPLGYHLPRSDSKHSAYFEEDDSAVLDPAILDADIMQSPSSVHFRKDSFANSNGVLSPAESQGWDHQYGGLPVEPASAGAANPYHEEHNGFARPGPPIAHPPAYGHPPQHPQWAFEQASGNCTPTIGVEFMPPPPHFETPQYAHHRTDSIHPNFGHPPHPPAPLHFNGPHVEPGFIPALQVQTPMSPHSHQDWMGMAQQEMQSRPLPKRMRPNSPPITMVDYARRDGIRKKNGRIEIPQEHNLHTIDELIDKTTDESLIKELKQQKRLLRNREAALASRQRKKKHTEELEVKEKGYAQQVTVLEKEVAEFVFDRQQRQEECQLLVHRFQESQRVIETLQEQIRGLNVQHNEETSSLRRKVNILTDQLEAGPAPAMSAAPSSTGFTDFNAEMEALNMEPHDWDNFIFVNDLQHDTPDDFSFDSRPESVKLSPALEKRPSSDTVMPSPPKKHSDGSSEQPIATGLLFMLLLCGAFVASKPASSQPRDMPMMPAEVRDAAPTVLHNLLSEAGSSSIHAQARSTQHPTHEPQPSDLPFQSQRTNSRLDQMHHRLIAPTKQQEIDQAFSLTTAQYASITNMNYPVHDEQPGPDQHDPSRRPRRNLAEALAKMQREHQHSSKAEVYTRSLLWDQIPFDVVQQFKEMVADQNEIDCRRNQRTSHEEMYGYKLEL
ncbi:hypothetical protein LTR36_008897 [Oleoguttula mirabilis]|uniref:BZIP domain-containing protein n=1 Tax=Oleoguttula mirabilis TaxID=1507867 RepID=A0AAV9J7F4_9PEZI|nr:hypothetical protein LTR36_008897 [Oleoguttula mirabilis]